MHTITRVHAEKNMKEVKNMRHDREKHQFLFQSVKC